MIDDPNVLRGPNYLFEFGEDITMGKLIHDQLISHSNKVAQIQQETGEEVTFEQIYDKSCKLAVHLKRNGVKINDRIAICSENNLGWSVPVCASLFVGASICPLNHSYSKRESVHTLNISKPKYIFVSPKTLSSMKNVVKDLSWSPTLVLTLNQPNEANVPSVDNLIANVTPVMLNNFEVTKVDIHEHIVSILCSSGTTGLPKGVMHSDNNYLKSIQAMLDGSTNLASENQVMIFLLPMFHSYCFNLVLMTLISGTKAIIFSSFQEKAFLETIEKYKIEVMPLVPPLMLFLAKHPMVDKYDLSSLKTIWCGAAPLSSEIEQAVKKRLNNPDIKQGYGMTELTFSVLKNPLYDYKPGSVGKLIAGCLGKVVQVDENESTSTKTLGPFCQGELCFKGDVVMKGYCDDPTSTSATIDKDGWLHTGDIGYYDNDGFFFIVDRLKELIKYKGFQVPPAELEAIILTHPAVKDVAVVGLPDEVAGELPLAFVVKQPNAEITAENILNYVNERVSNQKKLRGGVRFIENIPKNPSGKILRRELRNLLKSKL
ncbi:4-coumarate--CoA ligase 1 [Copidosoma floridanum]|uniref:4-coumarate--CoA ligase 1 n=1 Tax=Copidosoma floridanum TaxID=29053 RepID=UPI0006C9883F|nr:4-coumarate--CoA ligase 1 [Copidosoma floridanum]